MTLYAECIEQDGFRIRHRLGKVAVVPASTLAVLIYVTFYLYHENVR